MEDEDARLDRAFMALADPVRRAIVARSSRGPATVNELAAPFDITKQAVSKHIQVLEHAGLVTRTRDAQRRPVHLDAAALERLTAWIDHYRLDAERSYRRLDALLAAITDTTKEGREMTNALNLVAPVDTLAMEFTRSSTRRCRRCFAPTPSRIWSSSGWGREASMDIEHWDFRTHGGYRYVHSTTTASTGSTAPSTRCATTNSSSRPSNSRAHRTW